MRFSTVTDKGKVRPYNEDTVYASADPVGLLPNVFIIADGMGGHKGGKYASQYTADRFTELLQSCRKSNPPAIIRDCVRKVNRELFQKAKNDPDLEGMGTTLVLATLVGAVLYIANIGDSRLYLIRDGKIRQVTRDHSWVEEMVSEGRLDRSSSIYKENKNIITRAIGAYEDVTPDIFELDLLRGDLILMCSDGLTNMVEDGRICEIIGEGADVQDTVRALMDEAMEGGGRDNISIVLFDPEFSEVDTWC